MDHPTSARRFAQQTSQEHRALEDRLRHLEHQAQQVQHTSGQLLQALEQLASFVRKHFEAEQRGGYFAQVVLHAPWLQGRVEELHAQHEQLLKQLENISSQVDQAVRHGLLPLLEQLAQWTDQIIKHEHAENRLLQEAFLQDTAEGD